MPDRFEALARVIAEAKVVQSCFSPRTEFVHPSREEADRIAAAVVEFLTSDEAFTRFIDSFNGDEAGDIDFVWAADGATGYAMRGGNDVRAVFNKAILTAVGGSDE